MMKTVCRKAQCAGCMACLETCPKDAIRIQDNLSEYNAIIDEDKCVNCEKCHKICPVNCPPERKQPKQWFQGWASDSNIRQKSSSGGLATCLAAEFMNRAGIVCSCIFENGQFIFKFSDECSTNQYAGSKYVKSSPFGVYRRIRQLLSSGKMVLFIGLPCQVAGVVNFVGEALREKLFSVDLICHGTPSPNILNLFLRQHNLSLDMLERLYFRSKHDFKLTGEVDLIGPKDIKDAYTIAFLNALTYTESCYQCKFASIERVGDITLGDSWGSELVIDEQNKGISLVLCQTEKGERVLSWCKCHRENVDLNKAIQHNQQLKRPAFLPAKKRTLFFKYLHSVRFDWLVYMIYPKSFIKRIIKHALIVTKLWKRGGGYQVSVVKKSSTKTDVTYWRDQK